MAEKTISQLTEITDLGENAVFPVDTGTQTFKISRGNLLNSIINAVRNLNAKIVDIATSNWTSSAIGIDDVWNDICWSPELEIFVAVGDESVMTSPDGVTWTDQTPAAANNWESVCWSPELEIFVAVSTDGTGNRVMTSPDGVNWTSQNSAADKTWKSVCWSPDLGLFAAVSGSGGASNHVMTSPDGETWTGRTASLGSMVWEDVCWSEKLGMFCAVGSSGLEVMNSLDGETWTVINNSDVTDDLLCVAWSPELEIFAAAGVDAVYTSINGENWTKQFSSTGCFWSSIVWSSELLCFVAVTPSVGAAAKAIVSSPDGVNWFLREHLEPVAGSSPDFSCITFSPKTMQFCAISNRGTEHHAHVSYPYFTNTLSLP